jgi:hypothetical protein
MREISAVSGLGRCGLVRGWDFPMDPILRPMLSCIRGYRSCNWITLQLPSSSSSLYSLSYGWNNIGCIWRKEGTREAQRFILWVRPLNIGKYRLQCVLIFYNIAEKERRDETSNRRLLLDHGITVHCCTTIQCCVSSLCFCVQSHRPTEMRMAIRSTNFLENSLSPLYEPRHYITLRDHLTQKSTRTSCCWDSYQNRYRILPYPMLHAIHVYSVPH